MGDTVRSYLEGFDAKTVLVVEMRFNHDMSYEDIGDRLGMNWETVKRIIDTALSQLREELGEP